GIYDENSPLSDENGFRKDVLEVIKKLNVPILRWPGGNFASNYHWIDGIGPKGKRPKKLDTAWIAEDNNHFGTDEFIKYCRMINAEPYICLNFGTGTLDEALNWVEYCNYDGNTYYANLRKINGNERPFKVKYWGLGNEIYGKWQHGYTNPENYGEKAREYSQFIKKIDPEIETIAVGGNNPEWDLEVIKRCGEIIDFISLHIYVSPEFENHYKIVALPYFIEKRISLLENVIEVGKSYLRNEKDIKIAFDEWNIWREKIENEENYNLSDGLFACGVFHILQRHCNTVKMANLAQLVNVIGAIKTSKDGLFLTPIYYAFLLYSNNTGKFLISTYTESETYNSEYREVKLTKIPYIDVCASQDTENIFISVINRKIENEIDVNIRIDCEIENECEVLTMTGANPTSKNDFSKEEVKIFKEETVVKGKDFDFYFRPLSANILKIKKKKIY
ncbi:MAG: alpha-L-arabinofuranosidase C-terminal domain-containing protein, partial [Candidatus Ratteibacteria bacterium]